MNLREAFNETETWNGDLAYNSSLNKYIDTVFSLSELRNNPNKVDIVLDKNNEYDRWFGRVIRDCRYGFGKVMKLLSKVTEDLPDYILVLSDMQFNSGSNQSKDEAMKKILERSPKTRIIWWNLCSSETKFPETDKYGNMFLSGYNPTLLKFLETGFDGQKLIDNIIENYKQKMKDIIKLFP